MEKINLGIVAAEFNYDITFAMVELAKEHARFLDAEVVQVVKVPGVFDMPLAVKKMLARSDVDGLVVLGAVIEGSTEHDEIVTQHAARKIADLSLDYEKPIGFGISGPGMSRMEAHQMVTYAKRAVEAAVKMIKTLRSIPGSAAQTETLNNDLFSSFSSLGDTAAIEQPIQTTQETVQKEDDPLDSFFKEF